MIAITDSITETATQSVQESLGGALRSSQETTSANFTLNIYTASGTETKTLKAFSFWFAPTAGASWQVTIYNNNGVTNTYYFDKIITDTINIVFKDTTVAMVNGDIIQFKVDRIDSASALACALSCTYI